jgi:hypothetical protein
MRIALLAAAGLLATPGIARAELASIVQRDLPVTQAVRATAGAQPTPRFTLVGLHWRGAGTVSFRTRTLGGRWSTWRPAAPEDEDRPDLSGRESSRRGWRLGNPYWTGASDRIQYRLHGVVTRLRAFFVWSAADPAPPRALSMTGSPAIVSRAAWRANELIRRAPPEYAPALRFAVVHHTAGSNAYTREQSAAIVRGIQLYHVKANGWNDIGYNFLVDRYGQVFEGRYGGIDRNVVGAHAEGFNTGSTGVAVIGNYQGTALPLAARRALVRIIAWRLDLAHVDPLSTFNWVSAGNPKFRRGTSVFLRTVVGHRDTGFTSCPGDRVYALLDDLARAVSLTGLPKLYTPLVRGPTGGKVRLTARLSGAGPWTATVTDAQGHQVATGSGTGPAVDWTWDASGAAGGRYRWSIGGGGIRPATGVVNVKQGALALTDVAADPVAFTPNGDGQDDWTTISYRLNGQATVKATLVDAAGREVTTFFDQPQAAGPQSFVFTGQGVPDGTYRIVIDATGASGSHVVGSVVVLVNRILSAFEASRASFSPNGDGRADTLLFGFALSSPAQVTLRILRQGAETALPLATSLGPGPQQLRFDGLGAGAPLPDGAYEAEITVTDVVGTVSQRTPFTIDTVRPELRLVRISPLRFRVSEPADVVLWLDGVRQAVKAPRAGVHAVPGVAPKRVRAVAWDLAGNASVPARYPSP